MADRRVEVPHRQRAVWIDRMLRPDNPVHHEVAVFDCVPAVDPARLEAAWARVIDAHEALRTTVQHGPDGPLTQVVHSVAEPAEVKLARVEELRAFADQLSATAMRPDRLPRAVLGVLEQPQSSLLVLVVDHLVADRRSVEVLQQDLAWHYNHPDGSLAAGTLESSLRNSGKRASDLAFWRRSLRAAASTVELPFRLPRLPNPSLRAGSVDEDFDEHLTSLIDRVEAGSQALAAFARVLSDWSGADDLTVGIPVSQRDQELAIGPYTTVLPARIRVPAGDARLVQVAAEAVQGVREHADVAFADVVEAAGVPAELTRNPLFDVCFEDLTNSLAPAQLAGHVLTELDPPAAWSLYDLALQLKRRPDGSYRLRLVYAAEMWSEPVAAEFLRQCRHALLRQVAPTQPEPRSRIWSQAAARPGLSTCTDLVEAVLAQPAGRTALVTPETILTYGALADRITQVAAQVGPGGTAGVPAMRHVDLASAILGCWHAGRPVMLGDFAGVAAALELGAPATEGRVAQLVPMLPGRLGHAVASGSSSAVTFGSESLPEAFSWYRASLALSPTDVFCLTAPHVPDAALRDLVLPLTLGATVHVPAPRLNAVSLVDSLRTSGTTVWQTTVWQARAVIALGTIRSLPQLRHIVLHGDLLRDKDCIALRRLAPQAEIHQLYSTLETPLGCSLTRWQEPALGDPPRLTVPLDGRGELLSLTVRIGRGEAPAGAVGELVVTGSGLATGYVGRADRLPPAPVGAVRRVFFPGDLARYTLDGRIEILGRADRRAAARAEAVLAAHPEVVACHVASVREGSSELVAWYMSTRPLRPAALRAALRAALPAFALPSRFDQVESMPLDERGRVSTAALRARGQ